MINIILAAGVLILQCFLFSAVVAEGTAVVNNSTAVSQNYRQEFSSSSAAEPFVRYAPKNDRNPMLSSSEALLLKQMYENEIESKEKKNKRLKKEADPARILTVQGIIKTPKGYQAIINGEACFIGTKIRGAKIIKIGASSVVYEYKEKKYTKILR